MQGERTTSEGGPCKANTLIEERAELQDTPANGLDRNRERKRSGLVDQKDHAIQFAFAGTAREGEPNGMKEVAPTNVQLLFKERDHFLEPIGAERRWIKKEKREFADYVAGSIAGQDSVRFQSLQGAGGIVMEDELQKLVETGAIKREMPKQRGGPVGKDEMFRGRIGAEPGASAQDR